MTPTSSSFYLLVDYAQKHKDDPDPTFPALTLMSFLRGECWHIYPERDLANPKIEHVLCELCAHVLTRPLNPADPASGGTG